MFDYMQNRYLVQLSHPRVKDREMLVAVCIEKWNKDLCFYYPVDNIDNKILYAHILWKFSGDTEYVVYATAEADIEQADYNNLNLCKWDFSLH
jgi:hypothetical protein